MSHQLSHLHHHHHHHPLPPSPVPYHTDSLIPIPQPQHALVQSQPSVRQIHKRVRSSNESNMESAVAARYPSHQHHHHHDTIAAASSSCQCVASNNLGCVSHILPLLAEHSVAINIPSTVVFSRASGSAWYHSSLSSTSASSSSSRIRLHPNSSQITFDAILREFVPELFAENTPLEEMIQRKELQQSTTVCAQFISSSDSASSSSSIIYLTAYDLVRFLRDVVVDVRKSRVDGMLLKFVGSGTAAAATHKSKTRSSHQQQQQQQQQVYRVMWSPHYMSVECRTNKNSTVASSTSSHNPLLSAHLTHSQISSHILSTHVTFDGSPHLSTLRTLNQQQQPEKRLKFEKMCRKVVDVVEKGMRGEEKAKSDAKTESKSQSQWKVKYLDLFVKIDPSSSSAASSNTTSTTPRPPSAASSSSSSGSSTIRTTSTTSKHPPKSDGLTLFYIRSLRVLDATSQPVPMTVCLQCMKVVDFTQQQKEQQQDEEKEEKQKLRISHIRPKSALSTTSTPSHLRSHPTSFSSRLTPYELSAQLEFDLSKQIQVGKSRRNANLIGGTADGDSANPTTSEVAQYFSGVHSSGDTSFVIPSSSSSSSTQTPTHPNFHRYHTQVLGVYTNDVSSTRVRTKIRRALDVRRGGGGAMHAAMAVGGGKRPMSAYSVKVSHPPQLSHHARSVSSASTSKPAPTSHSTTSKSENGIPTLADMLGSSLPPQPPLAASTSTVIPSAVSIWHDYTLEKAAVQKARALANGAFNQKKQQRAASSSNRSPRRPASAFTMRPKSAVPTSITSIHNNTNYYTLDPHSDYLQPNPRDGCYMHNPFDELTPRTREVETQRQQQVVVREEKSSVPQTSIVAPSSRVFGNVGRCTVRMPSPPVIVPAPRIRPQTAQQSRKPRRVIQSGSYAFERFIATNPNWTQMALVDTSITAEEEEEDDDNEEDEELKDAMKNSAAIAGVNNKSSSTSTGTGSSSIVRHPSSSVASVDTTPILNTHRLAQRKVSVLASDRGSSRAANEDESEAAAAPTKVLHKRTASYADVPSTKLGSKVSPALPIEYLDVTTSAAVAAVATIVTKEKQEEIRRSSVPPTLVPSAPIIPAAPIEPPLRHTSITAAMSLSHSISSISASSSASTLDYAHEEKSFEQQASSSPSAITPPSVDRHLTVVSSTSAAASSYSSVRSSASHTLSSLPPSLLVTLRDSTHSPLQRAHTPQYVPSQQLSPLVQPIGAKTEEDEVEDLEDEMFELEYQQEGDEAVTTAASGENKMNHDAELEYLDDFSIDDFDAD